MRTNALSSCLVFSVALAAFVRPAASQTVDQPKAHRIERSLEPNTVSRIGGFIGTRLQANIDGYLRPFDIDHYVRAVETKKHRKRRRWQPSNPATGRFAKKP